MTGLLFSQDKITRMRPTVSISSGTGVPASRPETAPAGARRPVSAASLCLVDSASWISHLRRIDEASRNSQAAQEDWCLTGE
jgi:hypothetical protein